MKRYWVTIVSLGIFLLSVQSTFSHTGGEFLENCSDAAKGKAENRQDMANALWCMWYMSSVSHINQKHTAIDSDKPLYCLPDNAVDPMQKLKTAINYMSAHPDQLHQNADLLILKAFLEAFPCP